MKKYKLIAVLAASMAFTTGCYDLDVFPEDQLNSTTFFQTQAHADQAMMGVYSLMTDKDVFGRQFGFDCLGGVGSGYDPASYATIARGTYTSSEGFVTNKFQKLYEGISRANIVLQNVDKCDMTEELKERYKAEAKFMRALYYFTLMDFWGGVPIYDETTIVEDEFMSMLKPKSDIETVRQFILTDLEEGIKKLPVEWDSTNKGRATSGAALALKGKVLLYAGKYDEAKKCFRELIGETENSQYAGVYKLYEEGENPYSDLFKPGGDESSEMIFAIQNIGGIGQDFGMPTTFYMGTRAAFGSCWNNVMASVNLVDSYEWEDGSPFSWTEAKASYGWNGYPTYNDAVENTETKKKEYPMREEVFYSKLTEDNKSVKEYTTHRAELLSMYENRDPRMASTVILPYTQFKGWVSNKAKDTEFVMTKEVGICNETNGFIRVNGNYEYYPFRKFVAEYDMDGAINNRADTPINFPLIRLADVYLMLAECYIFSESGFDKDNAVKYINKVRTRKGVNMPEINNGTPQMAANTKEEVFERLRHERTIELAAEGHSFSDMKRWKLLETLNGPVYGIALYNAYYTRVVTERDYLWPFPLSECEKNPDLAKGQNPGW